MFVSESKFRSAPQDFVGPIRARDSAALEALITKPAVEAALLVRLAEKAKVYGQDLDGLMAGKGDESRRKIDAEDVVRIYRDFVIPMTKVVEVSKARGARGRGHHCRRRGDAQGRGCNSSSQEHAYYVLCSCRCCFLGCVQP